MALSRSPQLAELLNHVKDRWAADVRVALPGRVEKYDAQTQLVDVKPLVNDRFEVADGVQSLELPVIPSVPLMFPGAGGFHITFPVQKGDEVLLIFSDKSIDAWQNQGGISDPDDARRHHLTDAIAIPGLHNNKGSISSVSTSIVEIGKDGETSRPVALAPQTKDEITKVRDSLNALTTKFNDLVSYVNTGFTTIGPHVHTAGTPSVSPSPTLSTLGTPPAQTGTAPDSVSDINSSTVNIKG